ncbi:MAG: lysozyme inhibitor LprI family protein [Brevirhabdus sp.]
MLVQPALANPCANTQPQVQKSICYNNLGVRLEENMVTAYRLADAMMLDYQSRFGGLAEGLRKKLQNTQVAFETYRDLQCAFEADLALGGSGTGIFKQICRNDLTKQRIRFLKSLVGVN